jgi:phosphoglucomutase
MNLLAAEIISKTGRDLAEEYRNLSHTFGNSVYERMDVPANREQKNLLKQISPPMVSRSAIAGEKILAKMTVAPANGAAFGGIKIISKNGWFAVRPSGTEDIYKLYAESFKAKEHLSRIQEEAQGIIESILR